MAQIGEAVAVTMIDTDELKCPFDHQAPEPPKVTNDLIGKGGTLATRMKGAVGTHLYAKIKNDYKVDKLPNPRNVTGHPFFEKATCVVVEDKTHENKAALVGKYPVTCAAHHCIPAQESLKESRLLEFMIEKGDTEKLKDDSYTGKTVWSDVGYDVNGSQNGIWLPGSYAVGGGRGGSGQWAPNDDEDEDDEDEGGAPADAAELTGRQYHIDDANRCWQYVKQAMALCPGQFHDRHADYSYFVGTVLNKIFDNYANLKKVMVDNKQCPDCKERAKTIEKHGIPTPYGMVARLNVSADNLKTYLGGRVWRITIYTSKWAKNYMAKRTSSDEKHTI
jgi:hypothetical protein